ncbi:hypothetical protein Y1Q_0005390 [Alligator mississippiensis]|uniref:Uncharacterized protein n=1 Tax=Alligator mississippiensis TaxID=8496 RepID=A0A151PE88_ALLMI|nr:hypothetical protein Y1Q_0005390 [Alligator mississippiensis]
MAWERGPIRTSQETNPGSSRTGSRNLVGSDPAKVGPYRTRWVQETGPIRTGSQGQEIWESEGCAVAGAQVRGLQLGQRQAVRQGGGGGLYIQAHR